MTSGYVGKTLCVDLSEGMIHEEALDDPLTSVITIIRFILAVQTTIPP